jgi:hypothetical protein
MASRAVRGEIGRINAANERDSRNVRQHWQDIEKAVLRESRDRENALKRDTAKIQRQWENAAKRMMQKLMKFDGRAVFVGSQQIGFNRVDAAGKVHFVKVARPQGYGSG